MDLFGFWIFVFGVWSLDFGDSMSFTLIHLLLAPVAAEAVTVPEPEDPAKAHADGVSVSCSLVLEIWLGKVCYKVSLCFRFSLVSIAGSAMLIFF